MISFELLSICAFKEPPQIIEKPDKISVTVGDPVSLDCKVTGTPELKAKWTKDGKELVSSRQHVVSFANNVSSLKIQSAQKGDTGHYVFEVANHINACTCKVELVVVGQCFILFILLNYNYFVNDASDNLIFQSR